MWTAAQWNTITDALLQRYYGLRLIDTELELAEEDSPYQAPFEAINQLVIKLQLDRLDRFWMSPNLLTEAEQSLIAKNLQ